MTINIGLADIIGLAGSILSILAAVIFIFLNQNKSIPKIFLTISIITVGYGIFITLLLETGLIVQYPFLYRTGMPVAMFIGPSIYYYIVSELTQPLIFPKKYFLHLLPAVVTLIFFLPYHFLSYDEKIQIIENRYTSDINMLYGQEGILSGQIIAAILGIYTLLYLLQAARITYRNRKEIASESRQELNWYIFLLITISLIFVFIFVASFYPASEIYSLYSVTTSLLSLSMLIYLFTNPDILYGTLVKKLEMDAVKYDRKEEVPTEDKETMVLDEEIITDYCTRFDAFIAEEKPFLDRKLRITDLASQLNIPRHHLSWLVNNVYQLNFNDYMNQQRLMYIEENFSSEQFRRMTLEGIAFEAGFNSRTTFTHAVKKLYNKTPSEHFKSIYTE